MSTDVCVFDAPQYYVSGATKLNCGVISASTSGYSYVISAYTETIPFNFVFTANTNTFSATNASFTYNIYKYNDRSNSFNTIPVYTSETINYSTLSASTISGVSTTTQIIPTTGLTMDGDYIIKGFYQFPICTDYLSKLDRYVNTISYLGGTEYGIYDYKYDYYFVAVRQASIPTFSYDSSNNVPTNSLFQTVLPTQGVIEYGDLENLTQEELEALDVDEASTNFTIITIPTFYEGNFILTLNGLVLAADLDYTYSGTIATLNAPYNSEDVITAIYTTSSAIPMTTDVIDVNTNIVSGTTNNEGNNSVYYNTTTQKYEIYCSIKPIDDSSVLVMINGVTLANGLDYYQSTTNPKRMILEGDLLVDDVITIVYFPSTSVVNMIRTSNPTILWGVDILPDKVNGYFTLELASDNSFTSIVYTATTPYVVAQASYTLEIPLSGYSAGTNLYYRVKNNKNYETLCGGLVSSYTYSDTMPITIATNSINSY
jgi:hypothetical protein